MNSNNKNFDYKIKYTSCDQFAGGFKQSSYMIGGGFPDPISDSCWSYVFSSISDLSRYAHLQIDTNIISKTKVISIGSTKRSLFVFTSKNYPSFLFMLTTDEKYFYKDWKDNEISYTLIYRNIHRTEYEIKNTYDPQTLFNENIHGYCSEPSSYKSYNTSNNKNIVYQYLDKLMNSTKYGVSMTPEVVRLFKFRGIYILQTDYDNKRYVPRFISDILKEGPIFGIEYNKNLYQVILINKMNLVLKSNINFSYGDYPIPPTPPILPYGDTTPIIPPDLPGSSSNKFGPSSNTTTYSTPISYSTKNTINLQSTNITYNLLDTLNKILSWQSKGERISVSEDVFLNLKFKNFVVYEYNSIQNLFICEIFKPGPIFDVKKYPTANNYYYEIILYEMTSPIKLHNFDLLNVLPSRFKSLENFYNTYPYLNNYISKSQFIKSNLKKKIIEDDDSSTSSDEYEIVKKKSSKKKSVKKLSKKKPVKKLAKKKPVKKSSKKKPLKKK